MEVQRVFFIVKFEAKAKTIFEKKKLDVKSNKTMSLSLYFYEMFRKL